MSLDPVFSDLSPSIGTVPNVSAWYYESAIPGVPDTVAPYLSAHGYYVAGGAPYEIDGEFAGFLLNMYRVTFSHLDAIQTMLYAMVFAYNEGRVINDRRYEDIIAGMSQTLAYQQAQTDVVATGFNTSYTQFVAEVDAIDADAPTLADWTSALTALDNKVTAFDTEAAALRASYVLDEATITAAIATAFTEADAALTVYRGEVALLKTEHGALETSVLAILATETSDLAGHETEIGAALDALDDKYNSHLASSNAALASMETAITNFATASATIIAAMEAAQTAHETVIAGLLGEITDAFDDTDAALLALLATMRSDYTSHASTATGFLTGLGATELARINEEFANTLAAQTQLLMNRGFYSSAMLTDITTRNAREKSERIGKLNDDLNREKFENQHQLYGQQQAMRGAHIGVYQALAGLEQQAIQFRTQATSQLNASSQEIRKLSLGSREAVERLRMELPRLQLSVFESFNRIFVEIKAQVVSGLGQLQNARLAVSRGQADDYQKLFSQLSDAYGKSLAGEQQFAGIDARLRENQQQILTKIEELGQAWARVSAGLLETGIQVRTSSANLAAQVRQAYYDIILKQKGQQAQLRLGGATAKAGLLDAHINETNKTAMALFGFAERREDSYPEIGDMAALIASLGDDQ